MPDLSQTKRTFWQHQISQALERKDNCCLAEIGHTFLLFFEFWSISDPHLDFFKVVDLEISCLGSRSKNPELEYVSSYDTFHFPYFFKTWIFCSISTNPQLSEFLKPMAGFASVNMDAPSFRSNGKTIVNFISIFAPKPGFLVHFRTVLPGQACQPVRSVRPYLGIIILG